MWSTSGSEQIVFVLWKACIRLLMPTFPGFIFRKRTISLQPTDSFVQASAGFA